MWVVGIPWTVIGGLLMAYNVFMNVKLNKLWAGGNVVLLAITAHGFIHYLHSLLLVFEVDFFIKYMKFIRLIFLSNSALFIFIFFAFLGKFLWQILMFDSAAQPDLFTMVETMLIGYCILLNFPMVIIDLLIILKEVSLEYFQLWSINAGTNKDDISLGFHDLILLADSFLELFNPWFWFSDDHFIYE